MGTVNREDIRGYFFCDGIFSEVVCPDCITKEDLEHLRREEVLTKDFLEISNCKFFCDRCEKEI